MLLVLLLVVRVGRHVQATLAAARVTHVGIPDLAAAAAPVARPLHLAALAHPRRVLDPVVLAAALAVPAKVAAAPRLVSRPLWLPAEGHAARALDVLLRLLSVAVGAERLGHGDRWVAR